MTIERALTLYLRNAVTVDTGGAIDIRNLDDTQGGTADATQTCTATHTQDNALRTFDPATAAGATVANVWTLQKLGWALILTDMTPSDDTRCNCILPAGTATLTFDATLSTVLGTGDTTTAQDTFFLASLWAYDPSTDAGVTIALGGQAGVTWNPQPITGDNGVVKTITIALAFGGSRTATNKALTSNVATITTSAAHRFQVGMVVTVSIGDAVFDGTFTITAIGGTVAAETTFSYAKVNANVGSTAASGTAVVSKIEFAQGSVLLLQVGLNTSTIANPISGTTTRTYALKVDTANSKIVFATAGIGQVCRESQAGTGVGTGSRTTRARVAKTATGVGVAARALARVRATRLATGVGVPATTRRTRIALRQATGVGVSARTTRVRIARQATGVGTGARTARVRIARQATGVGTPGFSRSWEAFRSAQATGVGVASFVRSVIFVRFFQVHGIGVPSARLTLDIDDLPTEGGTPDWPVTEPVVHIAGVSYNHETGAVYAGVTVKLVRDSDDKVVQTTVADGAGAYDFERGTDDPYTYHLYIDDSTVDPPYHGVSDRGLVPA